MRVPGELFTGRGQANRVGKDRAGSQRPQLLRGEGQPVGRPEWTGEVEPQVSVHEAAHRHHVHPVINRAAIVELRQLGAGVGGVQRRKMGGISPELGRQVFAQNQADSFAEVGMIVHGEKKLQARSPTMVGGGGIVEAQHFRARADQRGAVRQAGEVSIEYRADGFVVKSLAQLEAGDKSRHGSRLPVREQTIRRTVTRRCASRRTGSHIRHRIVQASQKSMAGRVQVGAVRRYK